MVILMRFNLYNPLAVLTLCSLPEVYLHTESLQQHCHCLHLVGCDRSLSRKSSQNLNKEVNPTLAAKTHSNYANYISVFR